MIQEQVDVVKFKNRTYAITIMKRSEMIKMQFGKLLTTVVFLFACQFCSGADSTNCFNMAWQLIEKSNRTPEEDAQMVSLTHASLWHWTQRTDCSGKHLSIGYWQVSRVYALIGEADNARKYAQFCLERTPNDAPFFLGYAYEALAQAELTADNREQAQKYLAQAWSHAEQVTDAEDQRLLMQDLKRFK